jgi:hypothetical protein
MKDIDIVEIKQAVKQGKISFSIQCNNIYAHDNKSKEACIVANIYGLEIKSLMCDLG